MTRTLARLVVAGLVLVAALPAAAAANDARPIAIVGEDTLTTTDVRIELGLMKQRRQDDGPTMRPEAAQVLRRLVQNRLVIQEGYRMGLQDEFVVANPVKEFVMTRAMAAYLDSLERLRSLRLRSIAPGHVRLIEDPAAVIDWYVAHRLEREAKVLDALSARGPATVDELVPVVYADVDPERFDIARHSLHAHLRKLASEGRAQGRGLRGRWSAT